MFHCGGKIHQKLWIQKVKTLETEASTYAQNGESIPKFLSCFKLSYREAPYSYLEFQVKIYILKPNL